MFEFDLVYLFSFILPYVLDLPCFHFCQNFLCVRNCVFAYGLLRACIDMVRYGHQKTTPSNMLLILSLAAGVLSFTYKGYGILQTGSTHLHHVLWKCIWFVPSNQKSSDVHVLHLALKHYYNLYTHLPMYDLLTMVCDTQYNVWSLHSVKII